MTAPSTARRFIDNLTSEQRKQFPMCTGFVDYFPDAMAAVSHISFNGNEKHNKGQPLHHARGKSMDHPDCNVRHMSTRFDADPAYAQDVLAPVYHLAEHAWRAMALLQETMERIYGLPLAPAARLTDASLGSESVTIDQHEPPRCEAIDSNGVRCALAFGHEGLHHAPISPAHTCAIGSKERCLACDVEAAEIEREIGVPLIVGPDDFGGSDAGGPRVRPR